MNFAMVAYLLGQICKIEATLMILPLGVSFIYGERLQPAFLIPIAVLLAIGIPLTIKKPQNTHFYAKDAFAVVALSWFVMSFFGAAPFVISGAIPNCIDAFFETASGFTTTGATILTVIEGLPMGILFWRSLTHWIGGMGVLVFMLAIMPERETQSIFLMKAESTGPQVGKIVSKLRVTARILYGIYIGLTLIEFIFLLCGGMPVFDSIVNSFSTAGTGGFSIKNASIAGYNSAYAEYVIAVFMILFGINFNIFYLILVGQVREALGSEELRVYLGVIAVSTAILTVNLYKIYGTFEKTFRISFFQVSSIITTTGFATADIGTFPTLSKFVLLVLILFGACAGSTGGGIKIARVIILIKGARAEIRRLISPNAVVSSKFEGKPLDSALVRSTGAYLTAYAGLFAISALAVSIFDDFGFEANFTGVMTCLGNVGPGLGKLSGGVFADYSRVSKLILSFDMIAGRLELFPVLMLFSPKEYRR